MEPEKLIKLVLEEIGEDPNREGLIDTPNRVVRSWSELFSGYHLDPSDIFKTFSSDGYDELVLLKDIEIYSMCVVGSTFVETPRGRIPISKLKDGDWVYSYNKKTETFELEQCKAPRITRKKAGLVRVYTEKDTILCTPDHKFLCDKGWVKAEELKNGDSIISLNRGAIKVNGKHRSHLNVLMVEPVTWKEGVWCMVVPKNKNFIANGMVVHNCEHHMLPFVGKAHIAYIPNGKIIGISKLARLLEIYARRLQIQERLGNEVTNALMINLAPKAAACIIEAEHFCMRMRGVAKQQSKMVTSSLKGDFLKDPSARAELMRLIK